MGAGRNCVGCLEMMSGRERSWRILVILVTEVLTHLFPSCPSGLRGPLSFPIVPGARPLATETCLAKLLIQWILYFVWTVHIFYIFCTGSVWSTSLPCLIYPSSLFSVKWWIKRDTLKSATLAGGLIWDEGISVFNRHRKSSFHSNVCGCINSGYFCCCVITTQLTLLWDKQEYTGSQLESKGGGIKLSIKLRQGVCESRPFDNVTEMQLIHLHSSSGPASLLSKQVCTGRQPGGCGARLQM